MYVVTFYSYKGGVGRTMSLVNTASALVQRGKRVLMVDFDLEAPGLPSYGTFQNADGKRGIVDYVTDYVASSEAPDVADYIFECEADKLWLMPAGDYRSGSYSERLASIDWQKLYEKQSGYVMFEDIKQQWAQYKGHGFDYVLIDSRTGHTDVGGICTRQLPNAVIVMFLPNEQNIGGLESVVNSIRQERSSTGTQKIFLHFCPSNVPDLDDEEEILATLLERAKEKLNYSKPAAVIHHYNSLQLLSQIAFMQKRPNSRLAKEYMELARSIIAENLEDEQGAEIALERFRSDYRSRERLSNQKLSDMANSARIINENHGQNPRMAWRLAQFYSAARRTEDEIASLTVAIEGGYNVDQARVARAGTYLKKNDSVHAAEDLKAVLKSSALQEFVAMPAIEMLRAVSSDLDWVETLQSSPFLEQIDPKLFDLVSNILVGDRAALPLSLKVCRQVFDDERATDSEKKSARSQEILCLIGMGRFEEARGLIAANRADVLNSSGVEEVFNYAMAEWGEFRSPQKDLFYRVLELSSSRIATRDANFRQCISVAHYVTGSHEEALQELDRAREFVTGKGRIFSCWRYLSVTRPEMLEDIASMIETAKADAPFEPPFFNEVRRTVH
jgi:MinD-like ATPase involved in chromosome partitioning or flagellar assembly